MAEMIGFMFSLILICVVLLRKNQELKEDNSRLKQKLKRKDDAYWDLYRKNIVLSMKMFENKTSQITISKDTIEAVRYAMVHSHPDNGGNTEQFIKFKECYEKLKEGTQWT